MADLDPKGLEARGEAFPCQDCGQSTRGWFAPNVLWNLVVGGPEAKGDPGGFLCPNCFIDRAEAAGIHPTAWVVDREVLAATRPSTGEIAELVKRLRAKRMRVHDLSGVGWEDDPDCIQAATALTAISAERDEARAELRQGWRYPHMCRNDHVEIGHSVSDLDDRCPLCRMRDQRDYYMGRDEAGAEMEREAIARADQAEARLAASEATAERMRVALEEIAKSELTYDNWVQVRARAALSQDKEGTRE